LRINNTPHQHSRINCPTKLLKSIISVKDTSLNTAHQSSLDIESTASIFCVIIFKRTIDYPPFKITGDIKTTTPTFRNILLKLVRIDTTIKIPPNIDRPATFICLIAIEVAIFNAIFYVSNDIKCPSAKIILALFTFSIRFLPASILETDIADKIKVRIVTI